MTLAVITLLGTLASLVFWLVKRRAAQADDPAVRKENYAKQVQREVATDDERGANERLAAGLRALHGDQPGPGSAPVDARYVGAS